MQRRRLLAAWVFALSVILISGTSQARHGRPVPVFDLEEDAEQATDIVLGRMDAEGLHVEEFLKGNSADKQIKYDGLGEDFDHLGNALGRPPQQAPRPIEVVVFLCPTPMGARYSMENTIAALDGDDVYTFHDRRAGDWTRTDEKRGAFLTDLRHAIAIAAERDGLLAQPPSAQRTDKLIAFLLEHVPTDDLAGARSRHVGIIASALTPEQRHTRPRIAAALARAQNDHQRMLLINLLASMMMSGRDPLQTDQDRGDAVDELAPYAARDFSADVRRMVIQLMPQIDFCRTADDLAKYLKPDDPALLTMLQTITPGGNRNDRRSAKAVEALRNLSDALRARPQTPWEVSDLLVKTLAAYEHPKLLVPLASWAFADGPPTASESLTQLSNIWAQYNNSIEHPLDAASWQAWWKSAQPLLEADYDLSAEKGRLAWMDAYSRADQRARRYLMNLWLFESNIDDSTLLAASRGQDAGRALAAKEALQHLWTDDRLAPRTRQAIIQEYFRPELRAMMVSTNAGPYCVMTLVARPDFPFDGTPLAWRSDIKVGDAKPNLGEWIGSQDNQYTNREIVIGRGGDGPFEKPVTVHASLEVGIGMNQTNAQPTCIAHWDLGPLAPHAEIDPSGGAATRPGER